MSKNSSYLVLLVMLSQIINVVVSSDMLDLTVSGTADESKQRSLTAAAVSTPVFKPADDSIFSLNMLSPFPEDLEISDYCVDLLHIFGQRYVACANCFVSAARPVKVCANCFSSYVSLNNTYANISENQVGPGNVSCRDSLLRSDRLMLVNSLFNNLKDLWTRAACEKCVSKDLQSLSSDTVYFMTVLNHTLTCFEKYQQGNYTELCKNCKSSYKELSELYSRKEKNNTMCIDIEDSMNMTRILWSKKFNCSVPREETVPVIAVSSFMLFLPVIFYLSSFLHSEQKKRKLIHPKRAKSYTSLMNIQDKLS